jgi:hypothetical protein
MRVTRTFQSGGSGRPALGSECIPELAQTTISSPRVVVVAGAWNDWWRKRGDDRLALLLWAVWNPIGPVPLDEYENYTGRVVGVLRKALDTDRELSPPGADTDDAIQRQRNVLYAASVEELSTLLEALRRDQIGMRPSPETDRRAAETLLDWYEREMDALD